MSAHKIFIIALLAVFFSACSSRKKTTNTTAVTTTPSTTNATAKSSDGIYEPGNDELVAIQAQHKDVSLEKLKEGYTLYTKTACTGCHGPKNIYKRDTNRWKDIVDEMAKKAQISELEKDAVYKYVLSIKATQPK